MTEAHPGYGPHPGEIVFVEVDTGEERIEKASDVPASVAYVAGLDGYEPVVRVEALQRDGGLEIHSYGVDGQLLETTIGR